MVKKEGKSEAWGISGFTLGIVSLVLVIFTPFAGVLTSVVGFTFCILQQKKKPTKFGKRGIIINIIGLVINILWWILIIKFVYPYLLEKLQGNFPI